jgi:hypothetical protein
MRENVTVLPSALSPLRYATEKEDLMSRQEAATIYPDNLSAFHRKFYNFLEAEHILANKENQLLRSTVPGQGR